MNLLIRIFLAPLSSALFFNDLVKGSLYAKKSTKSLKAARRHAALLTEAQDADPNQTQSILQNYFKQQKKYQKAIKNSLVSSILVNLCHCKSKAHRVRLKAQKPYSSQLDVRRLMSNSIGYRDFIRAFLTPQQKVWLANQCTRFVSLESDHKTSSSQKESYAKQKGFAKLIHTFQDLQIYSSFDKALLRGLIYKEA